MAKGGEEEAGLWKAQKAYRDLGTNVFQNDSAYFMCLEMYQVFQYLNLNIKFYSIYPF